MSNARSRSAAPACAGRLAQPTRLSAYVALTKPDVSFLVLMTTAAGFYMGVRGPMPWLHMIHVVFRTMRRTASRPLRSGLLTPDEALRFGLALSLAGAIDLYFVAGYLACLLGVLTSISYLLAYTPLKKRTVWATFIGAIPGAIPPMIGWTAATGKLDAGAWLLFTILFFWQFPHFHAISWMYREDYARAGILMLPVVDKDGTRTFRQIILYASALIAVSLLPAVMGFTGVLYFFGALVTCTASLQVCLWAATARTNTRAKWLMHSTVMHIPILLGLMMYDKLPR